MELDDILPTVSRASRQLDRRLTLHMIPQDEQRLMHLFSQSSERPLSEGAAPVNASAGVDVDAATDAAAATAGSAAAAAAAAAARRSAADPASLAALAARGAPADPHADSRDSAPADLPAASLDSAPADASSAPDDASLPPFAYGRHNEPIFDLEALFPALRPDTPLAKFDPASSLLNHATLRALVVQLTLPEVIDYNLICDFFLTYRIFVLSVEVMDLLLTRLVWSLQYIALPQPRHVDIGKLVLVRTFVVLRHWILNYFVDDFLDPDAPICRQFVLVLRLVTAAGTALLRGDNEPFERKILAELATHWHRQAQQFWGDAADAAPRGSLPPTLPKSTTDISIHTNPSYRRSAMLLLYDQRTHHKCLIFDEMLAAADENPQMSINNLLLHHSSSRASINQQLQHFQHFQQALRAPRAPPAASPPPPLAPKHNHISLQDSSVALKKTTSCGAGPRAPAPALVGFATNGNVKLPSAKVDAILPTTPVKKMEYSIRDVDITKPAALGDDVARRNSIKKLVDGWKRSFHPHGAPAAPAAATAAEGAAGATGATAVPAPINGRVDILLARIVDELEHLIRYYIREPTPTTIVELHRDELDDDSIVMHGLPKRQRPDRSDEFPEHNIDSDISDLNVKRAGLELSDSFQRPASINWTDAELDRSHDTPPSVVSARQAKSGTQYFDVSSEFEPAEPAEPKEPKEPEEFAEPKGYFEPEDSFEPRALAPSDSFEAPDNSFAAEDSFEVPDNSFAAENSFEAPKDSFAAEDSFEAPKDSFDSSILTPSNLTQYGEDVTDLGILSPQQQPLQSRQSLSTLHFQPPPPPPTAKRISFNEANINYHKRLSIILRTSSSSAFKRDSAKSYISYDSVFLSSNGSKKDADTGFLRKKAACANLRGLGGLGSIVVSDRQSAASSARSIRYSTLFALTELPFANESLGHKRLSSGHERSMKLLDVADSSIFSVAIQCKQTSRATKHSNSSSLAAIPGISNYVLKELAAIPDELFRSNDPVQVALYRLEGVEGGSRPKKSPNASFDNTEDILNEINNANTLDIASASDGESQEAPLTPRMEACLTPTKTPVPLLLSPKAILDVYTANDALAVSSVLAANLHVSFILSFDSERLAQQFTVVEQDLLQEIDWKELIELNWNKELQPVNSWLEIIVDETFYSQNKGINLVIARFNLMVNWIISEILLTQLRLERIHIMSRLIHVAQHCFELQNFLTLMQIILGLTLEKVGRLKETWNSLPPGDILILKNLEELASPLRNFLNIRLCINQLTPSKGCIPFVGLYLSDLVFNAERPAFIKAQAPEPMINFARFRTAVHIVKSLSQCIEWAAHYRLPVDKELLSKCLYVKSLDETEMNYCLAAIERTHLD